MTSSLQTGIEERSGRIRDIVRHHSADAALITFLPDIRWASGFSGSSGVLIVRKDKTYFLSDGRYATQARVEVRGAEIHIPGYKIYDYIAEQRLIQRGERIIVQADHLTLADLDRLKELIDGVDWVAEQELLSTVVAEKDESEIHQIRAAQYITEKVFETILGLIRPGITEKDLESEIIYRHLQLGADKMSFDPIVAAGSNGALPHARPGSRKISGGDLIVLDFGCFVNGYASDMTRTIAVGKPPDAARRAYEVVLEAQSRAIDEAHAGLPSNELDAKARAVIEQNGLEDYFPHSLGHGIGLQVHEWPKVSYLVEYNLPASAAVTIEPGVYVPDEFGIRIEDIIVLQPDGCDLLTNARKDLIVL